MSAERPCTNAAHVPGRSKGEDDDDDDDDCGGRCNSGRGDDGGSPDRRPGRSRLTGAPCADGGRITCDDDTRVAGGRHGGGAVSSSACGGD